MKKLTAIIFIMLLLVGCSNNVEAITLDEAQRIALSAVYGEITKAKKDQDDSVYDFEIISNGKKYEIEVDAISGKIIKNKKDDDYVAKPVPSTSTPDNSTTTISSEEAQKIAMERVGNNGYLVKCELDIDNNKQKYEIEIKNGNIEYEIDIDANTGEIIKYEEDHD